jgi:hypothetical protein
MLGATGGDAEVDSLNEFPSFDEVVERALAFVGVGGSVIVLIGFAFALQSWLAPARAVGRGAVALRKGVEGIAHNPPSNPLFSLLITLIVLTAQLGALGICFLSGNYIALFADKDRGRRFDAIINSYDWRAFDLAPFRGVIKWDSYSSIYVIVGIILICFSYRSAWSNSDSGASLIGTLMAAPAALFTCLAGIGVAIALVITIPFMALIVLFTGAWGSLLEPFKTEAPYIAGVVTGAIIWGACVAAVAGSTAVSRAWH